MKYYFNIFFKKCHFEVMHKRYFKNVFYYGYFECPIKLQWIIIISLKFKLQIFTKLSTRIIYFIVNSNLILYHFLKFKSTMRRFLFIN